LRLTLITPVPAVTANLAADSRVISGLALPYGTVGRTNAGPVTVRAGAVALPGDLRRVKLFSEHGRRTPVGYALTATDGPAGLSMTFRAAGTPDGDTALLEASEGVRDALSVELDNVVLDAGNVTSADLMAVALTSIPAFADARIVASASDTPPAHPDDVDTDDVDDDTDENEDDTVTPPAAPPVPSDPPAVPLTPTATPAVVAGRPARGPGLGSRRPARTGTRGLSLSAAMDHVVTMIGGSQDANAINAALSDIVPAADTSDGAWIRPQWVDELWTPVVTRRPYAAAVTSGTLTGMKVHGWKWGTRPVVGPYAGNKTPIPSGPVTFGPAEATAVRHAGGWDVDRIFVDLGDSGLLTAILQAAAYDYGMKQEEYISDTLQAEGTPVVAAGFIPGLQAIAAELSKVGAAPSFIGVSADVWGDYTGMSTADAPWWLTSTTGAAASVNLTDGSSSQGGLSIFVDPNLAPNTIVGGDKRAVTFYEPRGNPFRVQAVNIPNGGVDIGLFGYCAIMVNDARGVIVADVTTTP
jgi:hypothetical protein